MILPYTVSLSAFRARHASQGMAGTLANDCRDAGDRAMHGAIAERHNAAMDADKFTRRALPWCSATVLQHLTRVRAIACVLCLVAKHHGKRCI